jgi:hypothetical protein
LATLTTQTISRAGIQESLVAAAGGGDACECGDGSPITVTLNVPATTQAFGEPISNRAVSVTNAQHRLIGPIKSSLYRSPTTGLCSITYSGVTSVTVGVFKLPAE